MGVVRTACSSRERSRLLQTSDAGAERATATRPASKHLMLTLVRLESASRFQAETPFPLWALDIPLSSSGISTFMRHKCELLAHLPGSAAFKAAADRCWSLGWSKSEMTSFSPCGLVFKRQSKVGVGVADQEVVCV